MIIRCSKQIVPPLGANLNSTITYTVRVAAISIETNFSKMFTCDDTNRCNLTILNSELSTSDTYNVRPHVSVVAANIFGPGPPAVYVGKMIPPTCVHEATLHDYLAISVVLFYQNAIQKILVVTPLLSMDKE